MIKKTQAIGIDLGGTHIKAVRLGQFGEIKARINQLTNPNFQPESIANQIGDMVEKLSTTTTLAGVGVGIPGVTTANGFVLLAPNLQWQNVPFKRILQERINLPIEIDNDANVAALAEARAGVGDGNCKTFVLLTLGTGIGGGIVQNGQLYHGASFSAGEIGHMCVLPQGPLCSCGKHGCLEALSAGPAMVRFVRDRLSKGHPCLLKETADLTPETVCNAARIGDKLCNNAIGRSARYLGIAIANLIHLLSPDIIAIGGGISEAGNLLYNPILESAREHALEDMFNSTKILLAKLRNDAGSIGAAFLVL